MRISAVCAIADDGGVTRVIYKILNFLLDAICLIGMAVCGIGLLLYIAAALAVVNAEDIMRRIDEWIHRG